MKTTALETAKFGLRVGLLVALPLAISRAADLQGDWKMICDYALPILLPLIDKWVHEDPRIPRKGIVPF